MLREDAYDPSLVERRRDNLVVLSGCSGGGKSSLLSELARRGYAVVEESGRQIVREQTYLGGDIFPWTKPRKFVELCMALTAEHVPSPDKRPHILRSQLHGRREPFFE